MWRHNDRQFRWELAFGDVIYAWVVDEVFVETDLRQLALALNWRFGSVPPLLEEYLCETGS